MPISQGMFINKNATAAAGEYNIQPVETDGFEDIGFTSRVKLELQLEPSKGERNTQF